MSKCVLFVVAAGLLVACCGTVFANGMYKSMPGYPALPEIPVQRALIVYQDGIETLVVESMFDSPSPEVAWILPLPAEPTKIEQGEPGMLLSASMALRAKVTTRSQLSPMFLLIICGVILLVIVDDRLMQIYYRRRRSPFIVSTLLLCFIALSVGALLPALGRVSAELGGGGSNVDVLSSEKVGNYEVVVLRSDSSDDLSSWLTESGMQALSEDEILVFDDYITRGWCFAVARLVRDEGGMSTPHPLAVTFPVKSAVFPMKATGLAGGTTQVELVVVSDKQAVAEGFDCVVADRFEQGKYRIAPWDENTDEAVMYRSRNGYGIIGHPDLQPYLWEGCAVTKLQAKLTSQQMASDIEIEFDRLHPYRQHWVSKEVRSTRVKSAWLGGVLMILVSIWSPWYANPWRLSRKTLVMIAFVGLVAVAGVVGINARSQVYEGELISGWYGMLYRHHRTYAHVMKLIEINKQLPEVVQIMPTVTKETFSAYRDWAIKESYLTERYFMNPFTGKPMIFERSPGNYSRRVVDGVEYLCFYDINGREYRVKLPCQGGGDDVGELDNDG